MLKSWQKTAFFQAVAVNAPVMQLYQLPIGSFILKAGFIPPYCELHFLLFILKWVHRLCTSKVFVKVCFCSEVPMRSYWTLYSPFVCLYIIPKLSCVFKPVGSAPLTPLLCFLSLNYLISVYDLKTTAWTESPLALNSHVHCFLATG